MHNMFYCHLHDTKIGPITLACDDIGLTMVNFGICEIDSGKLERHPFLDQASKELLEYLDKKRTSFQVPLHFIGTEFQKKVWQALSTIPYGTTRSYSQIAEMIHNPLACRAVGLANHNNPIAIIVPCHRVIGKNGKLTGYAGGLDLKKYLLNLENVPFH